MKYNLKLIQLFPDKLFYERLKVHLLKVKEDFDLELILGKDYFGEIQSFHFNQIVFVDSAIVEHFTDNLHELSIFNDIIYVYSDEVELVENSSIPFVCDHILPCDFSFPLLYSIVKGYIANATSRVKMNFDFPVSLLRLDHRPFDLDVEESSRLFIANQYNEICFCNNNFALDHQFVSFYDLNNSSVLSLNDPQLAARFTEWNNLVLQSGQPLKDVIGEMKFPEGNSRRVKVSISPLRDRTGKIWYTLGSYLLLEMERPSEVELFQDWRLLQILMDNITDTIYFKDLESRFIRINKAQANLIGIKNPEEAIGKTDFDYFNIEHSKKAYADELRIINNAQPVNNIEYIGTKDGHFRWMSSSKVPVTDESGKVIGIVGITRDIDKMVRVEHRLKAERDLLQLLIDHIPSPIYFKDNESRFTRVNLAQAKLLGANSVEDVLGKSDFDFYSNEDALEFYNDEQVIIENKKPLMNKIEECFPPGEGMRWFSTTKIPIKNEEGELSGIVGVSHDITDQILVKKDLEKAIAKAEVAINAKSNFLSNMSHEIRTPMNGVIGMAEVLNMTELDEEQKKIVNLIIRSGNNLLNIINDILDFSKIENGKILIESSPIDIKLIIREVFEMFIFSAAEKNINFYYKIDANIPEIVKGDSLRLKQVLINLISNAIKFTREGEVVIEAGFIGNTNDNHCIIFKVIDTGIGIGAEEKQYLFDAFTQADVSSTKKYSGTGLGLAISSRLVNMMGGNLNVISEKGKGSTFFFDVCFNKIVIDDYDSL